MIALAAATKFAQEQTRRNSDAKTPRGGFVQSRTASRVPTSRPRPRVTSGIEKLLATSTPLPTKGLEELLQDGDFGKLGEMLSLDGLMGIAAQFLPPWAGDALAVGQSVATGDLAGAADALISRYLPPELKAVYDAIKGMPGGWPEFVKWLFENPVEPQGAAGPHAARLGDIAACPGGAGPIVAPCLPSVLIGGMPAARRGDIALCNGLPIEAVKFGEPTVWMGGYQIFAARKSDSTEHGGEIESGLPSVHIGKQRGLTDMRLAGKCLSDAADSGAATIGGAGIDPVGEGGLLSDIAAGAAEMAKKKLAEFAAQKATEAIGGMLGDGERTPRPQPPMPNDEDFAKTKRNR